MKTYMLEVEVDEKQCISMAKHTDQEITTVEQAMYTEMGWLEDSGIYFKDIKEKQ